VKKLLIETSQGTFSAYLTAGGVIKIYQGDDDIAVATVDSPLKRRAVYDLSSEGICQSVQAWLETNHARVQVERVILHKVLPGK
jgi:hypothetical protein